MSVVSCPAGMLGVERPTWLGRVRVKVRARAIKNARGRAAHLHQVVLVSLVEGVEHLVRVRVRVRVGVGARIWVIQFRLG